MTYSPTHTRIGNDIDGPADPLIDQIDPNGSIRIFFDHAYRSGPCLFGDHVLVSRLKRIVVRSNDRQCISDDSHVRIFNGSYDPWLWACVGIWAAERLLRLVRLVLFSWKGMDWRTSNAVITAGDIEDDHLLRLTVSTSLTYTPKPGTYYFLYFPTTWSPWENHPFTLSGWTRRPDGQTDLHFLVKEQKGATRRLARRTRRAGNRLECQIWVEGPYGRSAPLDEYRHILMVSHRENTAAMIHNLTCNAMLLIRWLEVAALRQLFHICKNSENRLIWGRNPWLRPASYDWSGSSDRARMRNTSSRTTCRDNYRMGSRLKWTSMSPHQRTGRMRPC